MVPVLDALPPPEMAKRAEEIGVSKASLDAVSVFTLAVLAGALTESAAGAPWGRSAPVEATVGHQDGVSHSPNPVVFGTFGDRVELAAGLHKEWCGPVKKRRQGTMRTEIEAFFPGDEPEQVPGCPDAKWC